MPTVVKTWAFASDSEGLADAGNHPNVAFAAHAGDGKPADCVKFTCSNKSLTDATEFARRATTGETWESWGVPAGATVTDVQITAWEKKLAANNKLSAHTLKVRIIDSSGLSVHSAGDLLSALPTATDASWQAQAAGPQRAVNSAAHASTRDVRLELEYIITTLGGGGPASIDQRLDQIALTITYITAHPLAGSAIGTSSGIGSAIRLRTLAGSSSGVATGTGALDRTLAMGGTGLAQSGGPLSLAVLRSLGGSTLASSSAAGALGRTWVLGGASLGSSSVAGTVQQTRGFSGASASTSQLTGQLAQSHACGATVTGVGSTAAALDLNRGLAGTVSVISFGSAVLDRVRALAGAAAATSSLKAVLNAARALGGFSASTSDGAAALAATRKMAGAVAAASSAAGLLGRLVPIAGRTTVAASLTGALVLWRALAGAVAGVSSGLGALEITSGQTHALGGVITGSSTTTGFLTGCARLQGTCAGWSAAFARFSVPTPAVRIFAVPADPRQLTPKERRSFAVPKEDRSSQA